MYILLSGYIPFSGSIPAEVFNSILHGKPSFEQKEWEKVSEDGKEFLK
jgi:hypothetical protein